MSLSQQASPVAARLQPSSPFSHDQRSTNDAAAAGQQRAILRGTTAREAADCATFARSGATSAHLHHDLIGDDRRNNLHEAAPTIRPPCATRAHGITDSACKNQLVVVSVQYGPFNTYIPIRSTTIGKSRVARDPIAMHTSWRSNSDIASVTSIGYLKASGESSTTKHQILHASGPHPIPPPNDPKSTTIGKSRVARDPIAMRTSWRSNSDIAIVTSIGYPRMSTSVNPRQRCIDSYMHRGLTQSRRLVTPIAIQEAKKMRRWSWNEEVQQEATVISRKIQQMRRDALDMMKRDAKEKRRRRGGNSAESYSAISRCYLEIAIAKRCRLHKLIRQRFALALKIQQMLFAMRKFSRDFSQEKPAGSSSIQSRAYLNQLLLYIFSREIQCPVARNPGAKNHRSSKAQQLKNDSAAKQLTTYEELSNWMSTAELNSNGESDKKPAKEKDTSTVPLSSVTQLRLLCKLRSLGVLTAAGCGIGSVHAVVRSNLLVEPSRWKKGRCRILKSELPETNMLCSSRWKKGRCRILISELP
ncbi:hypothetical protein F511_15027 [Dorcoceras hygrometricum]|uniref:Uncharacterized protein n=1 Tax=Dorcoceras hygrometricum TaxID=472368 RepID=A0A2Z7D6I1_9LAMI|nr:hypothetical protein F511_15027 [Dorcoceras hygrometricum]